MVPGCCTGDTEFVDHRRSETELSLIKPEFVTNLGTVPCRFYHSRLRSRYEAVYAFRFGFHAETARGKVVDFD